MAMPHCDPQRYQMMRKCARKTASLLWRHIYKVVFGGLTLVSILYIKYLVTSTPFSVYILDKLNLRTLFLPNIMCQNCNNFTYGYLVENRNACAGEQEVFLLQVVMSYHANVNARNVIRRTWGGITEYRGLRVNTIFAFGTHQDKNLNNQMHYEMEHYGDVIQADFADNYRSLTNKTMMALRWVTQHCPSAQYILKTDDDSFNVPQRYVDYLVHVKTPNFIGGYCFTVMPDRRVSSKFYTPEESYPDVYYPTYCAGPAYVMSQSSVRKLVSVGPHVKFLTMEDVFVTGLCRVASRQQYQQIVGTVVGQPDMTSCNLATWVKNGHKIVPERTEQIWQEVVKADRETDCVERNAIIFVVLITLALLWLRFLNKLANIK